MFMLSRNIYIVPNNLIAVNAVGDFIFNYGPAIRYSGHSIRE